MTTKPRATRQDIFEHLQPLVGKDTEQLIIAAVAGYSAEEYKDADRLVATLDERIGGGYGVYVYIRQMQVGHYDAKDRPILRPFYYIHGHLESRNPARWSRWIAYMSCFHVESVCKEFVKQKLPLSERLQLKRQPLGKILRNQTFANLVPASLLKTARWLNGSILVQAKHGFNDWENAVPEDDPAARLFALDEAIAVCLIARSVGYELMGIGGFRPKNSFSHNSN